MNTIKHVSDTALLTAACRAIEARQINALVWDRFAQQLAGEKGMELAQATGLLDFMRFVVCARDRFMDDLLIDTVRAEGIQTVVNLGAGLDTRPWRLNLPATLRWIEADFPNVLEYKASRLASEASHCRLQQIATDLAREDQMQALVSSIGTDRTLIVAEGLLMYLTHESLRSLFSAFGKPSAVSHWLLDVNVGRESLHVSKELETSPMIQSLVQKHQSVSGQAILDAAQSMGWRVVSKRTYAGDGVAFAADRVARMRAEGAWLFGEHAEAAAAVSGVYLLARA